MYLSVYTYSLHYFGSSFAVVVKASEISTKKQVRGGHVLHLENVGKR